MANNIDFVRYDVGDEVIFRDHKWRHEKTPVKHTVIEVDVKSNENIEYQLVKIDNIEGFAWVPAIELYPWDKDIRTQVIDVEENAKHNKRHKRSSQSVNAKPSTPKQTIVKDVGAVANILNKKKDE